MRIEEYLGTLPEDIISGEGVQLTDDSFRKIFDFIKLGRDDVFYHLGCGDGRGLEIAVNEYDVKSAKGIDINKDRIAACRDRKLSNAEFVCSDIRDADCKDATVILFWFTDQDIIETMAEKFQELNQGCKIITILDPLLDFKPDRVEFPYLVHTVPLTKANSLQEQLLSIFGVKCIDFVTAWEYAERYTKSIGTTEAGNDRFVTIMQSLIIWINAKNLGVACGEEMPESIRTYISILREFFGIEVEHLLKN